ncbi:MULTISPECIES: hypothetical protein [unclassified Pseudomonas]|uniref:hypothetical protein n=1 Tax=unclassified Pseudomonas TaxID=196821 RepID=UPI000C883033|nr:MULTISPECIES: hypothetical protein [unclassified Pseudomonas]PMX08441.1 hypothetical protein C1Y25_24005 [Pseudomonas sp. MPBC4-3]PMX44691.1 hypothetical protein C1Y20_24295 [Pseudomonas sp. FW301-21B01]PMY02222.1 hypothetical protein C1Y18_31275 [Pseudomonas sp. MPR-R5A]PNA65232.1 hypothetical protein C1Y14_24425 [Pseudomonas sp. MPR-R5B]
MIKTFVLVLFFHVGPWGNTDSNATTNIPNFLSEQECIDAGKKAASLVSGTKKEVEFICVAQSKEAI